MSGTAEWIPSNQQIVIDGNTRSVRLASGSIAVFAADRRTGERLFLFHVRQGESLWPLRCPPDAAFEIVAVPLEASCLEETPGGGGFAQEDCLTKLGVALGQIRPCGDALWMEAGRSLIVASGKRIAVESGAVLVLLDRGGGSLCGASVEAGSVVVLTPGIWLEAAGEAEWRTSSDVNEASCAATIDLVVPQFFRGLEQLRQSRDEDARRRFAERRQLNARVSAGALKRLAGITGLGGLAADAGVAEGATGDPLFDAFRSAAASLGVNARLAMAAGLRSDRVREIALASGLRTRTVVLAGEWWRKDTGPMVAHRGNGGPVALIPVRDGYRMSDPATGTTEKVDKRSSSTLNPYAHMLYAPLPEDLSTRSLLRHAMGSRRRDLRTVVLGGVGAAVLALAAPQGVAILIGQAIPDGDTGMVWQVCAGMLAAAFGSALFLLAQAVALLRIQSVAFSTLQTGVWDYLLNLSPAFFRRMTAGQLRVRADAVTRIHQVFSAEALRSLFAGSASFLSLALIYWYSPGLALVALGCGAAIVFQTWWNARILFQVQERWQDEEESLSGLVLQAINAVSKLRVAGAGTRAFSHWAAHYSRKQTLSLEIQSAKDRIRLFNVTAPGAASALAFWYLLSGSIGLGAFLACSAAMTTFIAAVASASDSYSGLVLAGNLWQRLRTILSVRAEVDGSKAHPGRLRGGISVENLTFRYRDDGPMILDGVSIRAEAGECIALTGPSGSGKSTLLNLVLRFETPQDGAIYVDGRDLAGLDITAVRRQIGVVTQDGRIMAGSLFENICAGGARTMDEAWEAARSAGLAEDIQKMPMGMHTVVSEGGGNLSGGQRQRVLIARALVLKPVILIFDEATSALDNRTQAIVTESLNRLKATRILVAHRLSTIRGADRIYVIEKGRVVQEGKFDELASTPGLFRELVSRQAV